MRLCPLWTRVGNSSQRESGDPIESCTSKCCQPNFDEAIFNSDVKTLPILNGNSLADHMKPPVVVVSRYAAFEDDENFAESVHCIFESTISDLVPNAEIDQLSKRRLGGRRRRETRD